MVKKVEERRYLRHVFLQVVHHDTPCPVFRKRANLFFGKRAMLKFPLGWFARFISDYSRLELGFARQPGELACVDGH